jgi:hypothetical protein
VQGKEVQIASLEHSVFSVSDWLLKSAGIRSTEKEERRQDKQKDKPKRVQRCSVNSSMNCVSPTKISWILRFLDKASLVYYVPDQTIP